eukprot:scaffold3155_cov358-Prasinococcus_capsulatus_cf.AAC.4
MRPGLGVLTRPSGRVKTAEAPTKSVGASGRPRRKIRSWRQPPPNWRMAGVRLVPVLTPESDPVTPEPSLSSSCTATHSPKTRVGLASIHIGARGGPPRGIVFSDAVDCHPHLCKLEHEESPPGVLSHVYPPGSHLGIPLRTKRE